MITPFLVKLLVFVAFICFMAGIGGLFAGSAVFALPLLLAGMTLAGFAYHRAIK